MLKKMKKIKWWGWIIILVVIIAIINNDNEETKDKEQVAQEVQETRVSTTVETAKEQIPEETKGKEQADSVTDQPSKELSKEEPVRFKGRGKSEDGTGRGEPKYVDVTGYVVVGYKEVLEMSDSSEKFPKDPWGVPSVKQIGDNKFEETKTMIPHKTKVKVIKQILHHEGWGNYEGSLLVESLENTEQFMIDAYNFVTFPYWEEPIEEAIKHGQVIAIYNGNGEKPALQDGV